MSARASDTQPRQPKGTPVGGQWDTTVGGGAATSLGAFDDDTPSSSRHLSIVFMQGDEADEVLDMIDEQGAEAAVDHLAQWDYGEETEQAGEFNGAITDHSPAGQGDHAQDVGPYMLSWNPAMGTVGLTRRLSRTADRGTDGAAASPPAAEALAEDDGEPVQALKIDSTRFYVACKAREASEFIDEVKRGYSGSRRGYLMLHGAMEVLPELEDWIANPDGSDATGREMAAGAEFALEDAQGVLADLRKARDQLDRHGRESGQDGRIRLAERRVGDIVEMLKVEKSLASKAAAR